MRLVTASDEDFGQRPCSGTARATCCFLLQAVTWATECAGARKMQKVFNPQCMAFFLLLNHPRLQILSIACTFSCPVN